MSRETRQWLAEMTRIGDTAFRGHAWHYRDGDTNHYTGAVPVADVKELFLPYEPIPAPLYITVPASAEDYARDVEGVISNPKKDAGGYVRIVPVTNHKAIVPNHHQDTGVIFAAPGAEYAIHGYEEWLVKNVQMLLDDDVHVSSAGLLEGGAVAWVELAISETQTVADFEYRPHLLASTSVNGKYKTKFGRKIQAVVCDNTLHIADLESGQDIAFKHTKGSLPKIADARTALGLILATGSQFKEEMEYLLGWPVNSKEFSKYLDLAVPMIGDNGEELGKAALTRRENKRETLAGMWRGDDRVAPWSGTAFGVVQLSNTFFHHNRGANANTVIAERNMISAINGDTAKNDLDTLNLLAQVSEAPVKQLLTV